MKRSDALPIKSIAGNLVFPRDGDAWACFRVRCHSYRAEPQKRRAALVYGLADYARQANADLQILRVSRRFDPETYARRLRDRTPREAHGGLWQDYIDHQVDVLEGLEAWTPEVFVCVRLADPARDFASRASHLLDYSRQELWGLARKKLSEGRTTSAEDVADRAEIARSRIHICLDARPATYSELQWLVRRAFCRGVAEPREAEEEPDAAGRVAKYWFGENGIQTHSRYLRAEGEFGESYQAGLCLGEVGHGQPFSRQVELMFTALEEYPWPIDAALNVRYVTNEQMKRRVRTQFARKSVQLGEEEGATAGAMGESHERVHLSRELYDRLAATGEPVLEGTLSFIVAAESKAEMKRRVRTIRDGFPWQTLYQPHGDQRDVWQQHLPGQLPRVRGYERPYTIEQVGAMVPHGTHEAGSSNGRSMYVAKTIYGRQPVFFDLREASGSNKPATIALLGTLGGGKTAFLQLLLYQAFLQGARIVDIDPKGDHRLHMLSDVEPYVHEIYLSPDEQHAGKLDPLRVAPDAERHDAAATFLIDVLHEPDDEVRATINGAINRILQEYGERACCMAVVEELEREGTAAGRRLRSYCEAGIVRLGFAKLDDPIVSRSASQVTYLNIRALRRAGIQTVRSEMSQSQRHGRAVLQLVALYAMKILGKERDRLKVLSFDEASFLTEDALGQQLLDTLARWGRSELAVPILSTQLLGDVSDQDNLIGHWFLFAMKDRNHAVRALDLLGLDERLAADMMRWGEDVKGGQGRAVYRDLQGRSEEIQVDLGGTGLLEALHTTPEDEA